MKKNFLISLACILAVGTCLFLQGSPKQASILSTEIYQSVTVKDAAFRIPHDILTEISNHVTDQDSMKQLEKALRTNQPEYDLTSEELFDLMVLSIQPDEQEQYLTYFQGQAVELLFDGNNILVQQASY